MDGWETDAYIMAVTFPENAKNNTAPTRYFMANGSFLRKNNDVILHSLSKVFMSAEQQANGINVLLQGQPLIRIKLKTDRKPATLMVNNASVRPVYTPGYLQIEVYNTPKLQGR
jgi:hypothetical protein